MCIILLNLDYIIIARNYKFLGEPLAKNIATALEAKHKLEEANSEVAKLILEKYNRVFSKNNGWIELQKINSIHGTELNINV